MIEQWRVGRRNGDARIIFRMVRAKPSKHDVPLGMMDTPELAAFVVHAANQLMAAPPWSDDPMAATVILPKGMTDA